jgi:hypothetical protein
MNMKAGSSGGPDKTQVFGISNATTEDLRTIQSVAIMGCLQSVLSTQNLKFESILNQQVEAWTTHNAVETERLGVKKIELCQLYMELKSLMEGTCALPYWPYILICNNILFLN